jgi:hypothetical protein
MVSAVLTEPTRKIAPLELVAKSLSEFDAVVALGKAGCGVELIASVCVVFAVVNVSSARLSSTWAISPPRVRNCLRAPLRF